MISQKLLYSGIMLLGTFISSVSQVMLKKASGKEYKSWIFEYLNPIVISAYFIFFVSSLMAVYSYKVIPLSLGAVLETTSYVYITVWGVLLFKEKINKKKLIALGLIIIGVLISSIAG